MSVEVNVQWETLGFMKNKINNINIKNNNNNSCENSGKIEIDDPSPRSPSVLLPPLPDLIPIGKNSKKGSSLNNNNNENDDNLNLTLEKFQVPWPHDNSINKNVVVTIDNAEKSGIYVQHENNNDDCEDVRRNVESNDVEESIVMRELKTTTCNNGNNNNINISTTDTTSSTNENISSITDESKTDERSSNEVIIENSPAKNDKVEEQHRKSSRRRTIPLERIAFATIINEGLFNNRYRQKANIRARKRNAKKRKTNCGRKPNLNRSKINTNRKNSNRKISNINRSKNKINNSGSKSVTQIEQNTFEEENLDRQVTEIGEEDEEYPRVNPIFLFIKQEDTRIVEVRCEDYDKRNRIRLTKTASGWKAMPRSDESSSVVFSLLPSSNNDNNSDTKNYISNNSNNSEEINIPDEYKNHHKHHHHHHNNNNNNSKKKKKKKHKKHKKKKKERDETETETPVEIEESVDGDDGDAGGDADEQLLKDDDIDIVEQCKQTEKAIIECKPPPELLQPNIWDEFDNIEAQIPSTIISVEELAKGGRIAHVREHNHRRLIPVDELGNGDAVQKGEELHTKAKDLRAEAEVVIDDDDDDEIDDDGNGMVEKFKNIYPGSASAVYEGFKSESECIDNGRAGAVELQQTQIISSDSEENDDDDHKHMSEYNLIEGIREIQSTNTEDILLHHNICGDNTMTGTELLDSLVEQHCEDNHILSGPISISDDYNDDDDVLMEPQPVADIISRLGESLSTSPKCLSFNEAGEIEGLSGDLFDTNHDHLQNPFTHDDLSIIKDLTENNSQFFTNSSNIDDKDKNGSEGAPIVISPDSCQSEELPKDLSCHKRDDKRKPSSPLRPPSHSSDAIQSPQPSGLPAVPPSPDIFVAPKNVEISSMSKHMQKEPLDLGKCRKSASPTVSCSEEAKRLPTTTTSSSSSSCSDTDEPKAKRVKTDPENKLANNNINNQNNANATNASRLIEMLSSGNDPDPLTQLRLLISNTAWKVPDPLLVPKDRLNAVLASPAREIPLLLTTRPELRLPEAFAFPNILQDPDILVISLSQLETILQTQDELLKAKKQQLEKQKQAAQQQHQQQPTPMDILKQSMAAKTNNQTVNPLLASAGLAGDIDAATAAAFNQMLWLPYLGQMGQFAPEFLKAMMSVPNQNLQNLMPFMNSAQQMNSEFCGLPSNALDYKRQLEFAMWQEAMSQANNANLARAMKVNQDHQTKKSATNVQKTAKSMFQNNAQQQKNINPLNQMALSQFMSPAMANSRYFAGSTPRSSPSSTISQFSPGYKSSTQQHQARSNQAKTPQMASPSKTKSPAQQHQQQSPMFSPNSNNPFFQFPTTFQDFHEQQQMFSRKSHDKHQTHQSPDDQKPRVTCKSLMNLLQPEKQQILQKQQQKLTNLMAMPGMELFTQQQQHELQQQLFMQQQQQMLQQQQQNSNQQQSSSSASTTTSQQQQHHHQHQQNQQQQQQHQGKLKVKPGLHLLDPAAVQRRLLNTEEMPEVGSTTNGLDESPDLTSALWHPLFGSAQKTSYNSPWQWTTITASGE